MPARLPNSSRAILDIEKLRDYCLNPLHPEGRHKARVFAAALGITQQDAEWLRSAILAALPQSNLMQQESTAFGHRFTVDVCLRRDDRHATVRTCWIIRMGEHVPRSVTSFVL